MLHQDITNQIISAFYAVYNTLGYGFLEKVYEKAMAIELRRRGLHVVRQAPVKVYYLGELVGEYYADLLVEDAVIEVGLLLNFGPKPEIAREVFTNDRKKSSHSSSDPLHPV